MVECVSKTFLCNLTWHLWLCAMLNYLQTNFDVKYLKLLVVTHGVMFCSVFHFSKWNVIWISTARTMRNTQNRANMSLGFNGGFQFF